MAERVEDPIAAKVRVAGLERRAGVPRWAITTISVLLALAPGNSSGATSTRCSAPIRARSRSRSGISCSSGLLQTALEQSLEPFGFGFGLAILVGVPLGLVIGGFRFAEAALGIYVTAGYALPLIALVPLLMLWLGLGFAVKAAVVMLMSVFPICINTWLGVKSVPKSLIDVGKSFVAPSRTILRRIVLPATLPYIMAGIRLAVGRGVVAMIVAEFFTAISGLGAIIINSANNFDTARMFVPVVVLMVLATLLTAVIGWIERRVAPWQAEIAGHDRE